MFRKLFKPKAADIVSPVSGNFISIDKVNDPVFSEKTMGDGFAVELRDGHVYSPVDGEIVTVFPTNHAIGIKAEDRNEILIHIGLDTVKFGGEGLKPKVQQGDKVKKGDLLVEVDLPFFKENEVDMTTLVIITNLNGRRVEVINEQTYVNVEEGELIAIRV